MQDKLNNWEEKLTLLGVKCQSLEGVTQQYSIATNNISKTLEAISKTYDFFRIADDTKLVVRRGFRLVKGDPDKEDAFFRALERLCEAKLFFQHHRDIKSSASVLLHISALHDAGCVELLGELEDTLATVGSCLSAAPTRPLLSSSCLSNLHHLVDKLERNRRDEYWHVYGCMRSEQVSSDLREYERQHLAHVVTLLRCDVPYRKGELGSAIASYLSFGTDLLRGEADLWSSVFAPTEAAVQTFTRISEAFLVSLQHLFAGLLERDAVSRGENSILHQANNFLARIDTCEAFLDAYDSLLPLCQPDPLVPSAAAHMVLALRDALVEVCVESVSVVLASSQDSGPALGPARGAPKVRLGLLSPKLPSGAAAGAADVDPVATLLGEACELQPITANILHLCMELTHFSAAFARLSGHAAELGLSLPPGAQSLPALVARLLDNAMTNLQERAARIDSAVRALSGTPQGAAQPGKKAVFLARRSLEAGLHTHSLYEAGDREAEAFVMAACSHVFLCNNLHALVAGLEEHPLPASCLPRPEFCADVAYKLQAAKRDCCRCIAAATALLPEDGEDFARAYGAAVATKDKASNGRLLKAKFSLFCSGFDALLFLQGVWRVSAPKLRGALGEALVETICPAYTSLFHTYGGLPFSKRHKALYLKHAPPNVEQALRSFFGAA